MALDPAAISAAPVSVEPRPRTSNGAMASGRAFVERVDRFLDDRRGTAIIVAIVALVSWPVHFITIETGLDPSYKAALTMAANEGLVFGRDLIYTFGPLGYLNVPFAADAWHTVLAIVVAALFHVALAALVVVLMRRAFDGFATLLLASALLFVVGYPMSGISQVVVYLFALGAIALVLTPGARCTTWEVVTVGVVLGLVVLVKVDTVLLLVLAAGTVAFTSWAADGVRAAVTDLAVLGASALVAVVGGWIVTGQPIGELGEWIRASWEVTLGYNAAMGTEDTLGSSWQLQYVAAVVVAVVYLWWTARAGVLRGTTRAAVLAVVAFALFAVFKSGFVRHDDGHVQRYFTMTALLPVALLPLWGRWRAVVATTVSVVLMFVFGAYLAGVRDHLDGLEESARFIVSSGYRDNRVDAGRNLLRAQYALPDDVRSELEGHTVHVDPYETAVAHAYPDLDWHPAPVFQSYLAFTPYLDDRNAAFLRGDDRPERLLRRPTQTIDQRFPRFESPAAMLEVICRYREVATGGEWQVLAAEPDRCGELEALEQHEVRLGDTIEVPQLDDAIVVARFSGLADGPVDRVRGLLHKPRELYMALNDHNFRFLPTNQQQLHALSLPECAAATGPEGYEQVESFRIQDRLAIPRLDAADDRYTVELFALPYEC